MLIALLRKDFKRLAADRRAFVVNLILPLLLTFIMGLSFGGMFGVDKGPSAIPVALHAPDLPQPLRDRLGEGLAEGGWFAPVWADSAAADALVRTGKAAAAIVLPAGALDDYLRGRPVTVAVWKDPGSDFKADIVAEIVGRGLGRLQAGEAAYRALWPDASPGADALADGELDELLSGDLADVWRRWRDPANSERTAAARERLLAMVDNQMALAGALERETLRLETTDVSAAGRAAGAGARDANLFDIFLPGFAVFFLMFGVAAGARDLQRERQAGTFARQLLSPATGRQIVLGKWAAAALQGVVTLGALLLAGAVLFKVNLGPDPWSLAAAVALTSLTAAGFFMLLALATPSEKTMDNLSTVIILVSAMVGGNFIPLDALPPWLHNVGAFTFNYWANRLFNGIMARNEGLAQLTGPAAVLAAASVALLLACLAVFTLRERRGRGGAA
jgi:ABC-2 type transport system permease protein